METYVKQNLIKLPTNVDSQFSYLGRYLFASQPASKFLVFKELDFERKNVSKPIL